MDLSSDVIHGHASNPEVPLAECSVYPCRAKGNTTAVGETVTRKPRSLQPKSCARWAVLGMGKVYRSRLDATKASRLGGKGWSSFKKIHGKIVLKLYEIFIWNGMESTEPTFLLLFWFLICFGGLPTLIWNSWMGLQGNLHHCSMYQTYALSSSVFYGRGMFRMNHFHVIILYSFTYLCVCMCIYIWCMYIFIYVYIYK